MTAHRPWPPPDRPWIIAQTWRDLLFAHWPVPPGVVRPKIPAGLQIDTFAGDAWVGIVPFHLSHITPRGIPRGWGMGFPELNLRTYVTAEGKPGVWFFSLDAASLLAVIGARSTFFLPYFWARMRMHDDAGWIAYASRRRHPGTPRAEFVGRYRPIGPVHHAAPGSLEDWLTARYCLYAAAPTGRLLRAEINHVPWPLQPAEADVSFSTLASAHGIQTAGAPLLHFARRLDMVTWAPEVLG